MLVSSGPESEGRYEGSGEGGSGTLGGQEHGEGVRGDPAVGYGSSDDGNGEGNGNDNGGDYGNGGK